VSKDPYGVLGVAKDASQDDIRKAYRRLAKELHPDLNPGDKKAEERFRDISGAYDILGDKEKRARFDRGEIDAAGQETPQHRYYREYADTGDARHYQSNSGFEDFADVSDLFGDLFGRTGGPGGPGGRSGHAHMRMRGQDVHYRLVVDFLEAVKGAKKRITLPDGGALDLTVPEGVADGQTLRLKGKGGGGLGDGPPGDALVEIAVRPHHLFERRGDDIHMVLPIGLDEAVLGAKIETPTVSGKVSLTVPKGASSGQVLRLRGRGVKRAPGHGSGHGDQLVELKIVMPSEIDDDLEAFMKEWRKTHAYDPRAKMKAA
jgi:DnaJ-class molecular chaperone